MGTVYCHLWLNRSRQEWLCGWGQRQGINPHLWGLWQLVDCSTRMSYVHSRFWKFLRKKDDSACNCFPLCLYLLILLYFFMRKRVLLRLLWSFETLLRFSVDCSCFGWLIQLWLGRALSFAVRSWLCRSQSGRPPTHLGFFFLQVIAATRSDFVLWRARLFLSKCASGISQTVVVWNKRVGVNIWKGNLHQPNQTVGPLSGSSGLIWLADLLLPMSPQRRLTWASVSWRPRSPFWSRDPKKKNVLFLSHCRAKTWQWVSEAFP